MTKRLRASLHPPPHPHPLGGDFIHMLALALRLKLEEVTINWQYIQ